VVAPVTAEEDDPFSEPFIPIGAPDASGLPRDLGELRNLGSEGADRAVPSTFTVKRNEPPSAPGPTQTALALFQNYLRLDDRGFRLAVTAAVCAGYGGISKPVVFFRGPFGAGKTIRSRMLAAVADVAPPADRKAFMDLAMVFPQNLQDHFHLADQQAVIVYDNLDARSEAAYIAICLSATGGVMPIRELYEKHKGGKMAKTGRPVLLILSGTQLTTEKQDCLSRHVVIDVTMPTRTRESLLIKNFMRDLPEFRAVVASLRATVHARINSPAYVETDLPAEVRMTDFCAVGMVLADMLGWPPFDKDYTAAIPTTRSLHGWNSDVLQPLLLLLIAKTSQGKYHAPVSQILADLAEIDPKAASLCRSAQTLGNVIRRNQVVLHAAGFIFFETPNGQNRGWTFEINRPVEPSVPSKFSPFEEL
jgi:hypothetical protein